MNKRLLWKLCYTIAAGTVLLFWAIDVLTQRTEQRMSFIDVVYQQELTLMGQEAERIYTQQGEDALAVWLEALQKRENTWAAVVTSQINPLANGHLSEQFLQGFRLGRSVTWKIHLYFKENPIMDLTFSDGHTHFLIQLPQRMRPGAYLQYTQNLLQFGLPMVLLIVMSIVLYRHVMKPLRQLEKATRQFSEGQYDVRVKACLGGRNDELAALAATFDRMAARTGKLIIRQRQLIADLSHELRTPLARIDMAVDCLEHNIKPDKSLARLKRESENMRGLVDDTLTLAWLENEKPRLNEEEVDLVELLEIITSDARFEYPDRILKTTFPSSALLAHSSHRALGQAFENVIRNALRYTPEGGTVSVTIEGYEAGFEILVKDEGPGVPEQYIRDIFKPFFRVEKSRNDAANEIARDNAAPKNMVLEDGHSQTKQTWNGGCGLGLALARRQLEAVGGCIKAANHASIGLEMRITLPA
ncbi:sensor histidine kinase [Alkalimarinus coralli]|uniref:sensor histidine kinase n=1 Tax=Alkalimarinus coralli TaxID=2935863 RepID=UPI00202AEA6A|nr:sensor histidine kinase [Alkalimarinus coralli]